MRAHLHMQVLTFHTAHDAAGFLVVRIDVQCTVCGEHEIVVAGHHVKPLLQLLQRVVDEVDPALVDAGEATSSHRAVHHISDPRNN